MVEKAQQSPRVGAYDILQELWADAFGVVYSATAKDEANTKVMLRVLAPELSSSENFIIRFELLKPLLPAIRHSHLLEVLDLGNDGNLFYITYALPDSNPDNVRRLAGFDARETASRHHTLELIFTGIAEGLAALEKIRDGYHKNGLIHDALFPEQIYLTFEKALVGKASRPVPRLGGIAETFLFFGDGPDAGLKRRMAVAQHRWRHHQQIDFFAEDNLLPAAARQGARPALWWHQHQFGALLYQTISGHPPRGLFPSLHDIDATLDPVWDELVNRCLSASDGGGYKTMDDVVEVLQNLSSRHTEIPAELRRLRDIDIPEGMALVLFDGKVELGSNDGPAVESPRFRARLKPFFMDVSPITCSQFEEFLSDYHRSSYSRGDDNPATLVSWHMAKAYCDWRSSRENLPQGTYRLPTEHEWEAACRGGNGEQYAWGPRQDPKRLRCGLGQEAGTTGVRDYPSGRFGIFDMLGNTWEWTESPFQAHPFSKHQEKGYDTGLKVIKGGCWFTPANQCRGSLRAAFPPSTNRGNISFRCVRTVPL